MYVYYLNLLFLFDGTASFASLVLVMHAIVFRFAIAMGVSGSNFKPDSNVILSAHCVVVVIFVDVRLTLTSTLTSTFFFLCLSRARHAQRFACFFIQFAFFV